MLRISFWLQAAEIHQLDVTETTDVSTIRPLDLTNFADEVVFQQTDKFLQAANHRPPKGPEGHSE